jgi:chemotaxis protein CheY-P-specific phosphatase CheC
MMLAEIGVSPMRNSRAILTEQQVNYFDSFLLDGTDKAIVALEDLFGLDIDSSNSNIEITPAADSEFLSHLGGEKLYAVTCTINGDIQGRISLLMRAADFKCLGQVMKPILDLLYLSEPGADLATLDQEKPQWLRSETASESDEIEFHGQMMDMLSELGNVLIGMYIKALHGIFRVSAYHGAPQALVGTEQQLMPDMAASDKHGQMNVVIENEFMISDQPINIWCLISPTHESFGRLLPRIHN